MIKENPNMSPKDCNDLLISKRKVRKNMYQQKNILDFYATLKKN
jgi:hypothetical protein